MSSFYTRAEVTEILRATEHDHMGGITTDSPEVYDLAEWGCPWSFNRATCDKWRGCPRGVTENAACWNGLVQRRLSRQRR